MDNKISRVTRSKEEAKAMYNKMSKWYDLLARFERKYRRIGLQKIDAEKGEIVLEVGFGTGHCILALAESVGATGKVFGIDISERMLTITKTRVEKAGLTERVELTCGDAIKLPFNTNFLDAIFMSFSLELFDTPEIPIILQDCQRTLQSGGRICVVAMSKKGKSTVMMRLYEWAHRKFPGFIDCRPIFAQKALEDANFQILDITAMSMFGLPVEIITAKKT